MSATQVPTVVVRQVLGPLLVGIVLNAFLFGGCAFQYGTYFASGFKDKRLTKATILWLGLIDILFTINSVVIVWQYVIEHFSDVLVLGTTSWNFSLLPLFTLFSAVPVQVYLAVRIHKFSGNKLLFAVLLVLIAGAAVPALLATIYGMLNATIAERNDKLVDAVTSWLAISVGLDSTSTGLMVFYLWKKRTAFDKTRRIISRCIQISVQSALPVTLCAIVILILTQTVPFTNIHTMFTLCLGRLYTLTFIMSLNARIGTRKLDSAFVNASIDLQTINGRQVRGMYGQDLSIAITRTVNTQGDGEWSDHAKPSESLSTGTYDKN